jgi:hypothetical protein
MKRTWSVNDEVLLEQYKGMIYKLAFKSWRLLPASVKIWVEPEDLVADAYLDILAAVKFRYRKDRSSKSTFIWTAISNMYLNFAAKHQASKRFGWRIPLDDVQWLGKKDGKIAEREALDALSKVYYQASEDCRSRIKLWFGQEPIRAKRSEKEKQFYTEFCQLAKRNGLSKDDCRELMRGGVWIP